MFQFSFSPKFQTFTKSGSGVETLSTSRRFSLHLKGFILLVLTDVGIRGRKELIPSDMILVITLLLNNVSIVMLPSSTKPSL